MHAIVKYPGMEPGGARSSLVAGQAVIENAAIRCQWMIDNGRVTGLAVENRHTGQQLSVGSACMPRVALADGVVVALADLAPIGTVQVDDARISAGFKDEASGLTLEWSALLKDDANTVVQTLQLTASTATRIRELVFIDVFLPEARQVGEVAGSVVVWDDIFMGVEHPLARNVVDAASSVHCTLPLESCMRAGQSWTYTCAIGVVPQGQLRRGFLYYLEMRRIHPYRQFLHYNNWYDVVLSRPTERLTEPEALEAIEYFGRELVEKRGVKIDAVVWDDGWDDFNTLWDFHKGFPDGFRNLMVAAEAYGIAQGVWMSPNGGYATAKDARIAYGKPLGYETNENGYSMGGAKYRKAFHAVCIKMIRNNGVAFFKFDGMGEGGSGKGHTSGTTGSLSNDIHAILELARDLHREDPNVYVSATAGTWASPFWLLYADNIWRQGGDSGHHGQGDTRQQWITYRDMLCYERVVKAGPLYPLNALMLHGILVGTRENRAPAGMVLDEKSVADEIWSFFGTGTCLQELYVSPHVMSDTMLDQLASAARWARANSDVLVDTHWLGGDPGNCEVYGWGAWRPGKGILTLRNPCERPQSFTVSPCDAFEWPAGIHETMTTRVVYPACRQLSSDSMAVAAPLEVELRPFDTLVLEMVVCDPDTVAGVHATHAGEIAPGD